MAIKISLGKLTISQTLADFIPEQLAINNIQLLDVRFEHLLKTMYLPFHHRDPFDRLIIAQTFIEDMTLLSIDSVFASYGVRHV